MADPYAERESAPVGERPLGGSPLPELVEALGGLAARGLGDLEPEVVRSSRFVAALVRDESLLPPIAAVDAAFAAMVLLRPGDEASGVARALESLTGDPAREIYLLKEGTVAGPVTREGAFAIEPELIEALLGAAIAGQAEWETDPDFGYEVVAAAPGLDGTAADAACPRLLYARADRVYEHAEAVAALKAARHRRASAIAGLDERVLAATGWPIEATGEDWK